MSIEEVNIAKAALEKELEGYREFLGTGIAKDNDGPYIVVYLKRLTDKIKNQINAGRMGVKVAVQEEGAVRVLPM
jgi:hypothetical protein